MRRAFRHNGFPMLFVGTTTSMFGDSVMLLVFSMWVKELTGSNAKAGLTFFWMVLPSLVAPLLGGPIDRVRRRPLLVWGNLASAVMLLPLLFVRDAGQVWVIWSVAFLYGVSFVVLPAGLNGLLKLLVPEDELVDANASLRTVREGLRLVGPLVGAAIFGGLGGGAVAVIDALSFTVAALLIARIPVEEPDPREQPMGDYWAELGTGARHLAGERVLRHVLVAFATMLLVLGFAEASLYAVLDAFGRPVEFAGVLVAIEGVGAVAGGLAVPRIVRRFSEPGTVAIGLALLGSSFAVVATASAPAVLLVAVVLLGFSIPVLFVAYTTLVQRRTPQRLMGRVGTALEVILGAPQAVSLAVGAALVQVLDYRTIFGLMAGVTLLGGVQLVARLGRSAFTPDTGAGPAVAEP
ncbi:MFS transporter [Intrasporangium oryzae]|uniref:MFS transporter n=1 Tax=Intrasporangium oryzae TaxID=412687 RepID=UPI0006842B69|nr:MFS transporter [Intrasporangium oryzae]